MISDYKVVYGGKARIMVVDDEEPIRDMLRQPIQAYGYECLVAGSGEEALDILDKEKTDVVITDIRMPGISGIELAGLIKKKNDSDIIVMTGYASDFKYENIIETGASDFITKPVSIKELMIRLKRILRERFLLAEQIHAQRKLEFSNQRLIEYSRYLNNSIVALQASQQELHEAYIDTINRLVMMSKYKDKDTGEHIIRMSRYSALIAEKIGMKNDDIKSIQYSAPLHDVGKIGIPDYIILKPGKLTDKEFDVMKHHTVIGAEILANSKAKVLKYADRIAMFHHEKWNGTGYPQGLSGDDIPLCARIISLADVFDALISYRPYKVPYPVEVALKIIKKERSEHFDPDIVDVFFKNINQILEIKEELSSEKIPPAEFAWSERDEKYIKDLPVTEFYSLEKQK
ncbi:MAG: response regulator [Desulfobacterales bacterium]|nr:response regulator [Desulfobacterales bacterium]